MVTARQTVVQPLGLVLTPNTYGQYPPGALSIAQNVVMRAPGELWQAPGFGDSTLVGGSNNDQLRKLAPLDAGHVYSWIQTGANVWSVFENNNSAALPSIANTTGLWPSTGQIWPVRARERMLVNTATCGVFVGDKMAPASSGDRALRSAGMPQPTVSAAAISGSAIPINIAVNYVVVLKRVFADGYQVVSVPSTTLSLVNINGVTVDGRIIVKWGPSAGVITSDIVEVYRTDGIANAVATTDAGGTAKLIITYVLTSGDIAASSVQLTDSNALVAPYYQTTGRELYTNPGQESALQANRQPNICNAVAKFKNYIFYGDITERPAWTFRISAGVGVNNAAPSPANTWFRTNGIGKHAGAGTITAGSPTITGVSATDLIGVKVGQSIVPNGVTGFGSSATVTAVGTSTITMSINAFANDTSFVLMDRILIDGTALEFGSYAYLLSNVNSGTTGLAAYEATPDSTIPAYWGTAPDPYVTGISVTIEPVRPNQATMTVAATNGANYQPPVPEWTATAKTFSRKRTPNLLQWSKDSEPEHVPPDNEDNVGMGTIIAMSATKNALWIFATDGLFRLSGDAPPWRVDHVDPSCILVAPQALCQLRDTIYAYTNYGMTAITDAGIDEFTTTTLNELFPGPAYSSDPLTILERNELDAEVIVSINDGNLYVYNTYQKAWTNLNWINITSNVTALAFQRNPASGAAVLLSGVSVPGFVPNYWPWNNAGVPYLTAQVQYQPLYGDDPLVMKQYVDETLIFDPADAGKAITVWENGGSIASVVLTAHNSDAYGTIGIPRATAISQSSAPGFSRVFDASSQFRFRGISQRYVNMSDQAWRK